MFGASLGFFSDFGCLPLTQRLVTLALATLMLAGAGLASAHSGGAVIPHKLSAIEVRGELPAPPAGVSPIKFGEFFRMPVGPYGLEPSEKLLALNGKRVRLVGYMVREENPAAGCFMLSPLPVTLGDEDESLSDDLPPSTVFVHLANSRERNAPYIPGLIHLTGTLEVGAKDEAEGRVSAVRLILDAPISKRILGAKPMTRAASK
jgi:hypothetical protein